MKSSLSRWWITRSASDSPDRERAEAHALLALRASKSFVYRELPERVIIVIVRKTFVVVGTYLADQQRRSNSGQGTAERHASADTWIGLSLALELLGERLRWWLEHTSQINETYLAARGRIVSQCLRQFSIVSFPISEKIRKSKNIKNN